MALLSSADYPTIRAAMDVSLNDRTLPDEIIGLDIYTGAAERRLASELEMTTAAVAGLTGESKTIAVSVAVQFAAASLCMAIPNIRRKNLGGDVDLFIENDWRMRADVLTGSALVELEELKGLLGLDSRMVPRFFSVVHGTRMR